MLCVYHLRNPPHLTRASMLTYHHAPAFLRRLVTHARAHGTLDWCTINDLAARHLDSTALRPGQSASQLGHVFAAQLIESGLLTGEVVRSQDGRVFVAEAQLPSATLALAA